MMQEGEHLGRLRVSSGTPWEATVGYSRAVREGNMVWVSGTTATGPDGKIVAPGDAYGQTRQTLANIESALKKTGARMSDVVQVRVYVTERDVWPEVGRALGETFGEIRPANALIGVSWLVDPLMLVEIEAVALIGGGAAPGT